ncbi:helix-turn-helix domain-containing protein [Cohnella hongkongensis]|uniref:Helix-turn-helix domain-containing protein n=1 Tax=Cohnella hongkongensis TaxID=178337 RepID=A0ABV9F8H0_9BACL
MRKTWFVRLLLSYMPIFLIVVTFSFFVFFQLLSEQNRKQAAQANNQLSIQAMRSIDAALKAIDSAIMLEIIYNKQLTGFFDGGADSNAYLNISAVDQMKGIILSYPIIDSIYLYRFEDEFVLSTSTSDKLDGYADRPFIIRHRGTLAKKWTGPREFKEFSLLDGKPVVSLVRGVPFIASDKGMIVVNVSTSALRSMVASLYDPESSFIRIRDAEGNRLFPDLEPEAKTAKVFADHVSSYTDWSYESGLINGRLVQLVSSLYNVWFVVGLLMIALSFIWLVYVTRRNSRPLEQIASRVRGYAASVSGGSSREGRGDEFTFIETALENIIEQSNQYRRKHNEDRHLHTSNLFHRLIEGHPELTLDVWRGEADRLQLPAPSGEQLVFVVEMDDYAEFCRKYSHRDQNLLKFSLRSMIQEMASKHDCELWTEWTSAIQLSVMAFLKQGDDEERRRAMLDFLDHVRSWTEQHLKFTVTIGIGAPARQLSDIPPSFKSALEALKYKISLGQNRLIDYGQTAAQGQVEVFAHLNAIRSIAQSYRMLEGDWKGRFDAWFDEMKQGMLTKDEIVNLMNYFLYYMRREMATTPREFQDIWETDGLPGLNEIVGACHSLERMKEEGGRILTGLAVKLQEEQDKRQHAAIIREMRKYIEKHYHDPNLSLEYLGEKFGIGPKYVSKLFKEQSGGKFVDFLIDVRMGHARRLLEETTLSVQEIADRVGYLNAISFSRVFRRIAGCSPSEYREDFARRRAE